MTSPADGSALPPVSPTPGIPAVMAVYYPNAWPDDPAHWLNSEEHGWFKQAWDYASTQTNAIPALAKVSPTEMFWAFYCLDRGRAALRDGPPNQEVSSERISGKARRDDPLDRHGRVGLGGLPHHDSPSTPRTDTVKRVPTDDTDLLWRIWEIATYCKDKTESCKAISEMVEKAWEPSYGTIDGRGTATPQDLRFTSCMTWKADASDEVADLRAELLNQWEYNHAEHCGCSPAHPHALGCQWPWPISPARSEMTLSGPAQGVK